MTETIPFFSIVTAVYNGAKYLPDLIESVQSQSFTNYEHIIIDDGSTDNGATVAILEQYTNADTRISWWSRENKGQYATQNEGIEYAKGAYLVCIAADDVVVSPDALQTIRNAILRNPVDIAYGKTMRMDENSNPLPDIELTWRPSTWLIKHIVYAQHCSVFVKVDFVKQSHLFFDPTYRFAGDWDWIIRLFTATNDIAYIKTPLSIIRMHTQQTSRTATRQEIMAEHRRVSETYGGSYRLHVIFTQMNNYRAMILIALDILRRQGLRAFITRIKSWVRKRFIH